MANSSPSFLTLVISFSCILVIGAATSVVAPTSFIRSSCKVTTYPAVCVQSLAVHANTIQRSKTQLVQTALDVSLARAQSSRVFVAKLLKFRGLKNREYKALKDCMEEMVDSTDRISKSVRELKYLGKGKGGDFSWHLSNAQTWVSAALTDENTCWDGFTDKALNGRIKSSIRAQVTGVAQVTSNALALVNNLANN